MKQKKKMKRRITFNSLYIEVLGPRALSKEQSDRWLRQIFYGRLNMTRDTCSENAPKFPQS